MGSKRILLVEDELHLQSNICTLLELQGYEVVCASNGEQGLREAIQNRPDLILCDVMMPVMNGFEMVKILRRTKGMANLPFIFLTAKVDSADVRMGMNEGADDYLTKPFTAKDLIATVKKRLERAEQISAEFESKLAAVRESMSRISSHEYMTPLSGILAATTLLAEHQESFSPEEAQMLFKDIHQAGLRLKRTLSNLLVVSKLNQQGVDALPELSQQGSVVIYPEFFRPIIQSVAASYETRRNVLMDINQAEIPINPAALRKITEELLDNAFKFSKTGQVITINGRLGTEGYELSIHNEGSYFKPENIEQIGAYRQFERQTFEQQGMGLGLFIARELIQHSHGKISVSSSPVDGTTVSVSFPASVPAGMD